MVEKKVPEIENPRRVLAVALEGASHHLGKVVKDLSGTEPTPSPTLSGITHPLPLKTQYYTATVPLWLDLIDDPVDWSAAFLTPEAKEVLEALGGLVVVFEIPTEASDDAAGKLIREVGKVVRDGLGGWEWDGVVVAVGMGEDPEGDWDERCAAEGMELVVVGGDEAEGARNEFGEKVGIPRLLEALQTNDWSSLPAGNDPDDPDLDSGDDLELGLDEAGDLEGLRQAILEASLEREEERGDNAKREAGGEDTGEEAEEDIGEEDVRKVESMMGRLLAVKEAGEGMPEAERRRMARRAVGEVMKEL